MFTLKGRQDLFKLTIPNDLICDEINEKYTKIIQEQRRFITKPTLPNLSYSILYYIIYIAIFIIIGNRLLKNKEIK